MNYFASSAGFAMTSVANPKSSSSVMRREITLRPSGLLLQITLIKNKRGIIPGDNSVHLDTYLVAIFT